MIHNWSLHSGAINSEIIDNLIEFVESNYTFETGSMVGGQSGSYKNTSKRKCNIAWVGNKDGDVFLRPMLWNHMQYINSIAFGFDIQFIQEFQYTIYDGNERGHYVWHKDSLFNNAPGLYDRKLSLILQLSNSDDYEGGDIIIEKDFQGAGVDKNELREKGTIFVFPSFVKHKVTPVTKGIRKSLVAWAVGPKFR